MMMQRQQGVALFVALVFLVILMLLGVSAVRNSTIQEQMATNLHQANMAFGAAQSGVAALSNIADAGDDTDPGHILFRARTAGAPLEFCVDATGAEAPCGSVYLDNAGIESRVNIENRGCVQELCFGFSIGVGTDAVQCLTYQVDASGDAYGVQDAVEWWAFQITSQC